MIGQPLFCFVGLVLLLIEPLIHPVDPSAIEEDAILRLQDPVALVGEVEHTRGDASQLSSIEGLHTLRVEDAEVIPTSDAKDRGIPLVDEVVR